MSTPTIGTGNGRTEALQNWYRAKNRAQRHDRNFAHYSTIVAAVLAIVAGTSGIFSVAITQGDKGLPPWAWGFMISIIALTATLLFLFGTLLFRAFRLRQDQEKEEDDSLMELIKVDPERMWPGRERALSPGQDDPDAR